MTLYLCAASFKITTSSSDRSLRSIPVTVAPKLQSFPGPWLIGLTTVVLSFGILDGGMLMRNMLSAYDLEKYEQFIN